MDENLKQLFEELGISEEGAKTIAATLTESTQAAIDAATADLKEAHKAEITQLNEAHVAALADAEAQHKAQANAYGRYIAESLEQDMRAVANEAVEQFIAESREKFVETETHQRVLAAFDEIKNVFELNGFNIDDNRALTEANAKLEALGKAHDDLVEKLNANAAALEESARKIIRMEMTSDLTETQKEKLDALVENVTFDTREEFVEGLTVFTEQVRTADIALPASPKEEPVVSAPKNERVAYFAEQFK